MPPGLVVTGNLGWGGRADRRSCIGEREAPRGALGRGRRIDALYNLLYKEVAT